MSGGHTKGKSAFAADELQEDSARSEEKQLRSLAMESPPKEYVVRNCLAFAYDALRSKERLMGETTTSYYEDYFQRLLEELGPPGKKWELGIPNSEVESFYLGGVSLGEFRLNTTKRWAR